MKFKFTYIILLTILVWTITNSRKNAATGFGTTYTNCAGCHTGSASTTSVDSMTLIDKSSGLKVTEYTPGTAYTLTFYGKNSATLNKYGFHLTHNGKGTYSAPPATTSTNGNFWAQTNTLTGTSSKFSNSITWTSPVAGSGMVTFNMYLNAVDGNGSDNNLDVCSANSSFTFNEKSTTTASDTAKISIAVTSGTNPSKAGISIGISATPIKGGTTPSYQWIKNGVNVGGPSTSSTYTNSSFKNNDSVWCVMTSSLSPVVGSPATSNKIKFIITGSAGVQLSETINFDLDIQNQVLKTMSSKNKNAVLEIYNLSGTRAYKQSTNNDKTHDISSLTKGIYVAHLHIDGQILTKKFTIQ
jgi:hypothetical protein